MPAQGAANGMMALKRKHMGPSEHDVPIPPVVDTALVWGLFMGESWWQQQGFECCCQQQR